MGTSANVFMIFSPVDGRGATLVNMVTNPLYESSFFTHFFCVRAARRVVVGFSRFYSRDNMKGILGNADAKMG